MPGMDGASFLAAVRRRWPDTARLLLTGQADVPSVLAAIDDGHIYRFLTKPWDERDMLLTVRHALDQRALRRDKARLDALAQAQHAQLAALNQRLEASVAARTRELEQAHAAALAANGSNTIS